jgi:DNA-binding NtrC family response regulator
MPPVATRVSLSKTGSAGSDVAPFTTESLHDQYAITRAEYERELDAAIADSFPASDPPPWTFGQSVIARMEAQVAPIDTTVLVYGESGTGKEFVVQPQ